MDKNQEIIIYNTPDGKGSVTLMAKDGSVWLSQDQMAELFDTSRPNTTMHIANILKDNELQRNSVCKEYLHTAADGKKYNFNEKRKKEDACNSDQNDLEELRLLEQQLKYNEKNI